MTMLLYRCAAILGTIVALATMPPNLASAGALSCIAVFDFELADTSLEGEIKGANAEEQHRLGLLSAQLRNWINTRGGPKSCDMGPVLAEAKAANLSYCGCIPRLTQAVGGTIAVVSSVHKVSNLILNIKVDVFDTSANRLLIQMNADIRSNTDRSWQRGLDWLIEHRLTQALAALSESR